jgi:hypothetical protein
MRSSFVLTLLACAAVASPSRAADLNVRVVTSAGRAVSDAVVFYEPDVRPPGRAIRFPWPLVVEQRNMQFRPFVLIAPVGSEVSFPNFDSFRHHVYSFSPPKVFELKLYGHEETRTVRFDKPGVIALGCNIHDDMSGFIRVVSTPFAAKSAAGQARIHDAPAGHGRLTVWHPYIKGGRDLTRMVEVGEGGLTLTLVADVGSGPMKHGGY